MRALQPEQEAAAARHRQAFLAGHGIAASETSLVRVVYEGNDYCRYVTLEDTDQGDGLIRESSFVADAMVVTRPGHALFLPLADCVGAVIHDPIAGILMVSHLGRHNLEQFGGTQSIEYLVEHHSVDPTNLSVWLSPAAGKDYYPLFAFHNQSLHDVAVEQLVSAGIQPDNITVSSIDSAADTNYYSHSEFLKGKRDEDGRFAIVAMMK